MAACPAMGEIVTDFEVGPRDGLQNEARRIPAELVDRLSCCGFRKIEVSSFISPKCVPQMADAAQVLEEIRRRPGTTYAALTPNLRGFERALAARADEGAIFASASEAFSQKSINCSVAESIERFRPLLAAASEQGPPVRGYVSAITDCPYSGPVIRDQGAAVAGELLRLGCCEVSLGSAAAEGTDSLLRVLRDRIPASVLFGHFQDSKGKALENIALCLTRGLRTFDASIAGLGGCPSAPGAVGNLATEAVCRLLAGSVYETGIDPNELRSTAAFARGLTA